MSDELEEVLQEIEANDLAPVYLVVGEEFLIRKAADQLVEKLVPQPAVGLNLITMDGATPRDVAAELATLPLLPGRKVVLLRDPEFLAPKKGRVDALGKAREAWKANRKKEAARRVLSIAARAGWAIAELENPKPNEWDRELGISLADADETFLKEVAAFCREEGLSSPHGDEQPLIELIEKGPPKGHALVVAVTELDTKSAFVKQVKSSGRLIEQKIASRLKDLDVDSFAKDTLAPYAKKIGKAALDKLKDRIGGNMRLFQSELVKLALFIDGDEVKVKDVEQIVGHAREEEYMELSDALQKRDFDAAMKYVHEGLGQGAAPLALLGAVTSVVRNLLMSHERMVALTGGKVPRNYRDFQDRVFPQIEAEAKASKTKVPHPYAAFMGMQAAGGYPRQELLRAMVSCAEADLALKFGGDELVLERLIWTLCGKARPWESGFSTIRRELER